MVYLLEQCCPQQTPLILTCGHHSLTMYQSPQHQGTLTLVSMGQQQWDRKRSHCADSFLQQETALKMSKEECYYEVKSVHFIVCRVLCSVKV